MKTRGKKMRDLDEYPEPTEQDLDMLWEMEQRVDVINCYTDLLKRIEEKYDSLLQEGRF